MRDYKNDSNSGKTTLVVKMGPNNAKLYHAIIVFTSLLCFATFIFKTMLFCMKNNKLNFELDEEFDDIIEKDQKQKLSEYINNWIQNTTKEMKVITRL